MKKKLRKQAREPALENDADKYHIKVYPEAQIIAWYPRVIQGNRIVTAKRAAFRLRAYDFLHCPDVLEWLKAHINEMEA